MAKFPSAGGKGGGGQKRTASPSDTKVTEAGVTYPADGPRMLREDYYGWRRTR